MKIAIVSSLLSLVITTLIIVAFTILVSPKINEASKNYANYIIDNTK